MKTLIACLVCGLMPFSVAAQTVTGRVVEEKTGNPVEAATVYIDGTSIGTNTDKSGKFALRVTFPCTMVVSHVTFEPQVFQLTESVPEFTVKMMERSVQLATATVTGVDTWKYDIIKFKKWFLGEDYWGTHAKIVNDQVLNLDTDSRGRFTAEASAPLIVDLPKLGYKVTVELKGFEVSYDRMGQRGGYLGFYFFSPYPDGKKTKKYTDNRKAAYYNSPAHFLKALYENKLAENGFAVYKRKRNENTRKDEIVKADFSDALHFVKNEMSITGLSGQSFVILYYYTKKGEPFDITQKPGKFSLQSSIQFSSDTCVVRPSGAVPDAAIAFSGTIGAKQVGGMLPEDFVP